MHVGTVVVGYVQVYDLSPCPFVEVVRFSFLDVTEENFDVIVAIGSCVFMPEPDCMSDFVRYRGVLIGCWRKNNGFTLNQNIKI